MDVISQHMFVPPPPLARPQGAEPVPPLLERLRLDLLAKQPHDRPGTALEMRCRLEEALDPEAHAVRLPARKGDVPLGTRAGRVPEWTAPSAASETVSKSGQRVSVLRVVEDEDGVTPSCMTGLAAQGVIAQTVGSVGDVDPRALLLVLDVGAEHQRVPPLLAALGTGRPVVVCAAKVGAAEVRGFIEAGAADVQRYPVSVDVLARKLTRFLRKL
jgi:serine/threonine-protein kinase